MNPRALDPESVASKLEAMPRVLLDLESLGPVDEERLRNEPIVRYGVERMLCVLVELASAANGHLT